MLGLRAGTLKVNHDKLNGIRHPAFAEALAAGRQASTGRPFFPNFNAMLARKLGQNVEQAVIALNAEKASLLKLQ